MPSTKPLVVPQVLSFPDMGNNNVSAESGMSGIILANGQYYRVDEFGNRQALIPASANSFATLASKAHGQLPYHSRTINVLDDWAKLTLWTGASSATPDQTTISITTDGAIVMTADQANANARKMFLKLVNTGINNVPPVSGGLFNPHPAPSAMPWALRVTAHFNPADIANAGHAGKIYLMGWAGSNTDIIGSSSSSPGVGNNGGNIALIYTNGIMQIQAIDAFNSPGFTTINSYPNDLHSHVFDMWFDGQSIKIAIDGVKDPAELISLHRVPQAMAFPFFGVDSGGVSTVTGGFALRVQQIEYSVPILRL